MATQSPHRLWTLVLVLIFVGVGCASSKRNRVNNDRFKLKRSVKAFHRDLRWNEFKEAAKSIDDSHRQEFLGRYEEYGDDFDIVNLEVEAMENAGVDRRRVTVEQKWLLEPDMTVREDTYIEIWVRDGRGWNLTDRLEEKEWQNRNDTDSTSEDESTGSQAKKGSGSTGH